MAAALTPQLSTRRSNRLGHGQGIRMVAGEGDGIVSLDSMLPTSKDGIQVDKMRHIGYNIEDHGNAMFP